MSVSLCSTSDVITFGQNWNHLNSRSAGGRDLSNVTQIRVIGSMEPEICTKMCRDLSEELAAKFPATTPNYSMVKIACLDDAFSEMFELEASPEEGQSLPQKNRKEKKGRRKKN